MARRQRLIERREELGLTQTDVARAAGCDVRTYRRCEAGISTPRAGDRRTLAEALEWTPAQLALALSKDPQPVNGHAVPGWLGHLASLEQAAVEKAVWEPLVVHALLQTAEYAFAVERADVVPRSEEGIARRVETRVARQTALTRSPDPLHLSVVLDESVLRRSAGGRDVMAAQLDRLVEVAERPNVDVLVLPLDAGRFSAAFGSFSLLTQLGATAPYMAVTEDRAGPHYLDRDHEIEAHSILFDHLVDVALDPDQTVDLIQSIAKEYRR
jgi:transcriptional regulator with XRE-family HTH domain